MKHLRTALLSLSLLSLLTLTGEALPPQGKLELQLKAKKTTIKAGERLNLDLVFINNGKAKVTLMSPGDGSNCAWRTPVIGWSILPVGSKKAHPNDPPLFRGGRCGNMNPVRENEIWDLAPGQKKAFNNQRGWFGSPELKSPGRYRIALIYKNDPKIALRPPVMGKVDAKLQAKVKATTPIVLTSNELIITVK